MITCQILPSLLRCCWFIIIVYRISSWYYFKTLPQNYKKELVDGFKFSVWLFGDVANNPDMKPANSACMECLFCWQRCFNKSFSPQQIPRVIIWSFLCMFIPYLLFIHSVVYFIPGAIWQETLGAWCHCTLFLLAANALLLEPQKLNENGSKRETRLRSLDPRRLGASRPANLSGSSSVPCTSAWGAAAAV